MPPAGIPPEALVRLLDNIVNFQRLRDEGIKSPLLKDLTRGQGTATLQIDLEIQDIATLYRIASGEKLAGTDILAAFFASMVQPGGDDAQPPSS